MRQHAYLRRLVGEEPEEVQESEVSPLCLGRGKHLAMLDLQPPTEVFHLFITELHAEKSMRQGRRNKDAGRCRRCTFPRTRSGLAPRVGLCRR